MDQTVVRDLDWVDPLWVAAGLAGREGLLCLVSDGETARRRSFVAVDPDRFHAGPLPDRAPFEALTAPDMGRNVVGLLSYDAGARVATGIRPTVWPDLTLARYPAMLAFDHDRRRLAAVGLGANADEAAVACARASAWIASARAPDAPAPPSVDFRPEADAAAYLAAVADVVGRIAAGELFQANIARAWGGGLIDGADPFDVFLRLAGQGGAPYAAYWSMGERALVSNSPELFLAFDPATARVETRPIKGTRARDPDPATDAALAADLSASAKDRAENLIGRGRTTVRDREPPDGASSGLDRQRTDGVRRGTGGLAGGDLSAGIDHRRAQASGHEGDRRARTAARGVVRVVVPAGSDGGIDRLGADPHGDVPADRRLVALQDPGRRGHRRRQRAGAGTGGNRGEDQRPEGGPDRSGLAVAAAHRLNLTRPKIEDAVEMRQSLEHIIDR